MLTLKTVKGMKTLRLAPQLHDSLQKEKVRVGDVVFIEANTGEKQNELKPLSEYQHQPPTNHSLDQASGPPFRSFLSICLLKNRTRHLNGVSVPAVQSFLLQES